VNRLFSPNVDAVDHPAGHVLVVGDIAVMPATNAAVIPAVAARVALLLKSFDQYCSLIGFVGDDDTGAILQGQLRNAGVSLDVLPVTDWSSYIVGPEVDPGPTRTTAGTTIQWHERISSASAKSRGARGA
jgi:hypothetical protein